MGNEMRLTYTRAAEAWEETLPIGNGSLGAMIWGGACEEALGLNQDSVWSGCARDKNRPEARRWLEPVRKLIFEGRQREAQRLIETHMLGEYNESYLPLGNLRLRFSHPAEVSGYRRTLDVDQSLAHIEYEAGGCRWQREYFASFPAQAIIMRFRCERKEIGLQILFDSLLPTEAHAGALGISLLTKCPEHVDPAYIPEREGSVVQGERGMQVRSQLRVLFCDGRVLEQGDQLCIENASEVALGFSSVRDPHYGNLDYELLRREHMRDYQALYGRVSLFLGDQPPLPTDERLKGLREGVEDNGLFALYFQYGRYLLISSSREGGLPANLQGIWSWQIRAPWSCNWTVNINAEMNYWAAQPCNLKECLEPFFSLLKRLAEEGRKTAWSHYGCRGSVLHHNTDYWCSTNPVGLLPGQAEGDEGSSSWAFWPMGLGWMASELFRHYEYNPDRKFLEKTAYPILREAALFFVDWLVWHNGQYVACPSASPENTFLLNGEKCTVSMNSAMDLAIIRELFGCFEKTCRILGIDDEILSEVEEKTRLLAPFRTGSRQQLLEWDQEFEEPEPGHRHVSPLYGLFPSELFAGDPALTEACRKTLLHRLENGGGHTGWSCAWIINLFAVLGDGESAYAYLRTLLTRSTYDNLWCKHPPFQIDGNFGGIAGIAHMLAQDRGGKVTLLPALPRAFANGSVRGLRLKDGKSADIEWKDGRVTQQRVYTQV